MFLRIAACGTFALLTLAGCERSAPAADPATRTPAASASSVPATSNMREDVSDAEGVISFQGFGPARFGDAQESVRQSWGRPLALSGSEPASCAYLLPDPRPAEGYPIAFMLVDGRFARYDVETRRYTAPGGGRIGHRVDELEALYAGRIQAGPHKYVEGAQVLVVTPVDGGDARLVFETGADGSVSRWRIGLPPAVHYVEGCS